MELLNHQQEAITHLLPHSGGLLSDSMGLGKTVTALGLDAEWKSRRTLIICPKSLIGMWERHVRDFFNLSHDSTSVVAVNPAKRAAFVQRLIDGGKKGGDGGPRWAILHWDALTRIKPRELGDFDHVIADEAHLAKNRNAKRTQNLKKITAMRRTALTGTPADDSPLDLFSLLQWLYPQVWTSYWRFFETYCDWDVPNPSQGYRVVTGYKNLDKLREEINPYYVRRRSEDVLGLPPKQYVQIPCEMHSQQRSAYKQMRKDMVAVLDDMEDDVIVEPHRLVQHLRMLQLTTTSLASTSDGGVEAAEPSGKLDAAEELITLHPETKFVVFSRYKGPLKLLAARLRKAGVSFTAITGQTEGQDRTSRVERFQSEDGPQVLLGTIGAAGVGLTLTAARAVVFVDRHWNPSVNAQAEDRLWRMGQKGTVSVYDLVVPGTVDEYRSERIETKAADLRAFYNAK